MQHLMFTLTTYRHLMLETSKKTNPVFIGPALIHQRRLFYSYFRLLSNIVKYNPKIQGVLVYGNDGERKFSDSIDSCFTTSKHLLCDIHMKGNIKRKLSDQNIKGHIGKEYIMENRFILKGYQVLWAVPTQRYLTKKLEFIMAVKVERHINGE